MIILDNAEFAMNGEDSSTTETITQYAVRVAHADGRIRYHQRASQTAAEAYLDYLQRIRQIGDWQIEGVDLVSRRVTITRGEWEEV
jgi:hypothetical protein